MACKIDFISPVLWITYIEKADYLSYIILEIQSSLCCLEYSYAEVKKKQLSRKTVFILQQNQRQKNLNDNWKKMLSIQNSSLLITKP